MSSGSIRNWYMFMATLLILAVIGLAYLSVFKPGNVSEWKIKIGDWEFIGTNVLLGFAIILFLILMNILPDLRKAAFELPKIAGKLLSDFIRLFKFGS